MILTRFWSSIFQKQRLDLRLWSLRTTIWQFGSQNRSFLMFEGVWTVFRAPDYFRRVEASKKTISDLFLPYKHSTTGINGQNPLKTASFSSVNHSTQNSLSYPMGYCRGTFSDGVLCLSPSRARHSVYRKVCVWPEISSVSYIHT